MSAYFNPAQLTPVSMPDFDETKAAPSFAAAAVAVPFGDVQTAGAIPPDMDAVDKFGAATAAAYRSTMLSGLSNSRDVALQDAIAERNKAVIRAGKQDFLSGLAELGIAYDGATLTLAS